MKKCLQTKILKFCPVIRLNTGKQMQRNLLNRIRSQDRRPVTWSANSKEYPSWHEQHCQRNGVCNRTTCRPITRSMANDQNGMTNDFQHFRSDAYVFRGLRAATFESLLHGEQMATKFTLSMHTISIATLAESWCCLRSGLRPFRCRFRQSEEIPKKPIQITNSLFN